MPIQKKDRPDSGTAIILTSHGGVKTLPEPGRSALARELRGRFPGCALVWAGVGAELAQAWSGLARRGLGRAVVLPLVLAGGEVLDRIRRQADLAGQAERGLKIALASPLLADRGDIADLAAGIINEEAAALGPGSGVVLVGHGGAGAAGEICRGLGQALQSADARFFAAALHGEPRVNTVLLECRAARLGNLTIASLFVGAGRHHGRDVFGSGPQSVIGRAQGLGLAYIRSAATLLERPCARAIWLRHLARACAEER